MPNKLDIFKTIGGRYQLWRVNDNTGLETFNTRAEAEQAMRRGEADEYGWEITDVTDHPALEQSTAARLSASKEATSKGLSKDSPGTDTNGDTRKVN